GTDEQGKDEIVDRKRCFPDEIAEHRVLAQPAQAEGRIARRGKRWGHWFVILSEEFLAKAPRRKAKNAKIVHSLALCLCALAPLREPLSYCPPYARLAAATPAPAATLAPWASKHCSSAARKSRTLAARLLYPINPMRQALPLNSPRPPPISMPNSAR